MNSRSQESYEAATNNSTAGTFDFCGPYPSIECRQLGHLSNSDESFVLDQMHQYCQSHPAEHVVYLHSKGSYHPSPLNENWRCALTMAATAKECIEPPNDQCDVCGALFYTQFTTFVPGNMFSAKCSYVLKLLSPLVDFPVKHREAVGEALMLRVRRQLTARVLFDHYDFYGLGRYNSEHWIGTL
jgi:hypothetical protein